jgi:hypothetical protein
MPGVSCALFAERPCREARSCPGLPRFRLGVPARHHHIARQASTTCGPRCRPRAHHDPTDTETPPATGNANGSRAARHEDPDRSERADLLCASDREARASALLIGAFVLESAAAIAS